jgi:hypothetical protein
MSAVDLPEARAACRTALEREMLLRSFSHDVAGAVMGTLGWVDLARMDGVKLPPQLDRGLARLNDLVETYREALGEDEGTSQRTLEALLDTIDIPWQGEGGIAAVCELRLGSALELAAPTRAELLRDGDSVRLRLFGLPEDAVRSAASPHFDKLRAWMAAQDRRLGVALLRVVTRSAGGEVSNMGAEVVELVLPAA